MCEFSHLEGGKSWDAVQLLSERQQGKEGSCEAVGCEAVVSMEESERAEEREVGSLLLFLHITVVNLAEEKFIRGRVILRH